ncbi:MAG TPA: F0F1 ATP synthase subunit B [Longimicrobium sp.]|nr:F0F1 ATP synthase subunit B [Longimicrobium sp.]
MRRSSTALVAPLLLAFAAPLAAQHEETPGLLSPNPGLTIWTIVVFVLVLVILSKFAFPKILGAVEAREAHLRELSEGAELDRREAAALLEENRRLMEETRARVQEAVNETRVSGERMRAEMMAETRRDQDAMIERARRDIAAERQAALDAVRREAVDVSMAAAERLVRRNLDGEDNRRLVREFLGQMQGAPATTAGL